MTNAELKERIEKIGLKVHRISATNRRKDGDIIGCSEVYLDLSEEEAAGSADSIYDQIWGLMPVGISVEIHYQIGERLWTVLPTEW
jgi:hypothetical protein